MEQVCRPETAPLAEVFHEFYDPNAYFHGNETALLGWLYERRHDKPVVVQSAEGERSLRVREQLAVELGHMCLLREDNLGEWTGLGLREEELQATLRIAEFGVASTVKSVLLAAANIKRLRGINSRIRELQEQKEADGVDIILAGAVVAANAHKDQKRLNGASFYTHPVSVATLVSIATRDAPGWKKKIGVLKTRLRQYGALTHDATEDLIPDEFENCGTSFLQTPNLLATPLLHKRLLQSYRASEDDANNAARVAYVLTKPAGIDGRMENTRYMARFVGEIDAILIKLADITHNLTIDPKEMPIGDYDKIQIWRNKRKTYENNITYLKKLVVEDEDSTKQDVYIACQVTEIPKRRLISVRLRRILSQVTSEIAVAAYEKALAA